MDETETDTTNALNEPIDIGSDTMLVEETEFYRINQGDFDYIFLNTCS
jgi:hypothetical protein